MVVLAFRLRVDEGPVQRRLNIAHSYAPSFVATSLELDLKCHLAEFVSPYSRSRCRLVSSGFQYLAISSSAI